MSPGAVLYAPPNTTRYPPAPEEFMTPLARLLHERREAARGTDRYVLCKRQLYGYLYGASLRQLHLMAVEFNRGVEPTLN